MVERIGERRIAFDETVRGRVIVVVAVDPGEGAAEIEVEIGRTEGSFNVDGDGVEAGVVIFVNGSDKGCLEREKWKGKERESEEHEEQRRRHFFCSPKLAFQSFKPSSFL